MKRRILFLCTGNSCRPQMAEAIVNHDLAETWKAYSAGTRPAGFVHPLAIAVLAEIGIVHHGRPKSLEGFQQAKFDLLPTVCDSATEECPVWPGGGPRRNMDSPDPARFSGTESEVTDAFRRVRDDIRQQVVATLQSLPSY